MWIPATLLLLLMLGSQGHAIPVDSSEEDLWDLKENKTHVCNHTGYSYKLVIFPNELATFEETRNICSTFNMQLPSTNLTGHSGCLDMLAKYYSRNAAWTNQPVTNGKAQASNGKLLDPSSVNLSIVCMASVTMRKPQPSPKPCWTGDELLLFPGTRDSFSAAVQRCLSNNMTVPGRYLWRCAADFKIGQVWLDHTSEQGAMALTSYGIMRNANAMKLQTVCVKKRRSPGDIYYKFQCEGGYTMRYLLGQESNYNTSSVTCKKNGYQLAPFYFQECLQPVTHYIQKPFWMRGIRGLAATSNEHFHPASHSLPFACIDESSGDKVEYECRGPGNVMDKFILFKGPGRNYNDTVAKCKLHNMVMPIAAFVQEGGCFDKVPQAAYNMPAWTNQHTTTSHFLASDGSQWSFEGIFLPTVCMNAH